MSRRRTVLGWLASSIGVGAVRPGLALAGPPALGQVFDGELLEGAGPGLHVVKLRGGFARLGGALGAGPGAVFSISNDNDRYAAVVDLPSVPRRMCFLTVAGGVVRAESWGSGFGKRSVGAATFHLDRQLAEEVAKLWSAPRRDRSPLGVGLVGRFRAKRQPFKADGPMEIVLEVENKGSTSVGFSVGGRQRGPRDNRFAFVVEQRGKPLPVISAPDFGGPMGYRKVEPGDKLEVGADLASWTKLSVAGSYQVRCSYQAELVPGTEHSSWPDHGHETWDLTLSGAVDLVVS